MLLLTIDPYANSIRTLYIINLVLGTCITVVGLIFLCVQFWINSAFKLVNGKRVNFNLVAAIFIIAGVLLLAAAFSSRPAKAADLPRMITHGHGWGSIGRFGTYSDAYLQRRWAAMCATAARYQAMSEAYELGKPQPCTN